MGKRWTHKELAKAARQVAISFGWGEDEVASDDELAAFARAWGVEVAEPLPSELYFDGTAALSHSKAGVAVVEFVLGKYGNPEVMREAVRLYNEKHSKPAAAASLQSEETDVRGECKPGRNQFDTPLPLEG